MSDNNLPTVRPTKKQRDLLTYIEAFIEEHGYSPSYREIMNGLSYTSVATVALHVNSLIGRGHLRKREHSARSLEVVTPGKTGVGDGSEVDTPKLIEEAWLISKVEAVFTQSEGSTSADLKVLISALRLLGLANAADDFAGRLAHTGSRKTDTETA